MSGKWARLLTYGLAGACALVGYLVPGAAVIATPAATWLAGWATKHPSDILDASSVADLKAHMVEISKQIQTMQEKK